MRWGAVLSAAFAFLAVITSVAAGAIAPEIGGLVTGLSIPPAESEAALTLKNRGDAEVTYALELDGPAWASIEPETLTVPAGSQRSFTLVFAPPEGFAQDTITIRAIPDHANVEYAKTLRIRSAHVLKVFFLRHLPVIIAAVIPILFSIVVGALLRRAKESRTVRIVKLPQPAPQVTLVPRMPKPGRKPVLAPLARACGRALGSCARGVGRACTATGRGAMTCAAGISRASRRVSSRIAVALERPPKQLTFPPAFARPAARPAPAPQGRAAEPELPLGHPLREQWLSRALTGMRKDIMSDLQSRYRLVPKQAFARKRTAARVRWPYAAALAVLLAGTLAGLYLFRTALFANLSYAMAGLGLAIALSALLTSVVFDRTTRRWQFVPAKHEAGVRTGWLAGLDHVNFKLSRHGEAVLLETRKGRRDDVAVVPGEPTYQYFHADWNLEDGALDQARFRFRVPKSWLRRNGIAATDVRLRRHENGRWVTLSTGIASQNRRWVAYEAKGHNWGQFAIAGRATAFPRRLPWLPAASAIAGVLIVAVAALAIGSLGEGGVPRIAWKQGEERQLDLGSQFDSGRITGYAVLEAPAHIAVTIDGSTARLTPAAGWSGTERAVFAAHDADGKPVTTKAVDLAVRKPLVSGPLSDYAWHAAIGAVILSLIVLAVEFKKPLATFLDA